MRSYKKSCWIIWTFFLNIHKCLIVVIRSTSSPEQFWKNKNLKGINKKLKGINKKLKGINKNLKGINKNVKGINKNLKGIKKILNLKSFAFLLWRKDALQSTLVIRFACSVSFSIIWLNFYQVFAFFIDEAQPTRYFSIIPSFAQDKRCKNTSFYWSWRSTVEKTA